VNIKLPENMAVGLILPLPLISLDNDTEDWLGNWPPLAHLLEEVDWAEFFRQIDHQSANDREALTNRALVETLDRWIVGVRKLARLRQEEDLDFEEILNILLDKEGLNLTGIIIRIDVASIDTDEDFPYFVWKHFYGYCETFAEVEGVIQSLTEKASQEVAV
jgi:hypothetical protein